MTDLNAYMKDMLEIIQKKIVNLGCLLGNQTAKSGCPVPFFGCPRRQVTQFIRSLNLYLNIIMILIFILQGL